MLVLRAPYRVSIVGGGTDHPSFYQHNGGGAVIGFALKHYCYLTIRKLPPFFEHKHRIVHSKIELVTDLQDITHPAVYAVLADQCVEDGLEIHHAGDLPARSGLGSSSSFVVALLHALAALNGRMISKRELAQEAIRIEREVIRETVGDQDQCFAAYGGLNRIDFTTDRFTVSPVVMIAERRRAFLSNLYLCFTGVSRYSSQIAADQVDRAAQNTIALYRLRDMVDDVERVLTDPFANLDIIGEILDDSWQLKRSLAPSVSTSMVDDIYTRALAAGAIGGKIMGAGGGGFMIFYVTPDRRPALKTALSTLIEVPVDIDYEGATCVVYEP